jgi:hypothetical protein
VGAPHLVDMHRIAILVIAACGTSAIPQQQDRAPTPLAAPARPARVRPPTDDFAELCRRAVAAGACHDRRHVRHGRLDPRDRKSLDIALEVRSPRMTIAKCDTLGSPMAIECEDLGYLDACIPACKTHIRDCDDIDPTAYDTDAARDLAKRCD